MVEGAPLSDSVARVLHRALNTCQMQNASAVRYSVGGSSGTKRKVLRVCA